MPFFTDSSDNIDHNTERFCNLERLIDMHGGEGKLVININVVVPEVDIDVDMADVDNAMTEVV